MKPKTLLLCIVAALMLSVFVIDAAPVAARLGPPEPPTIPAAGQWIVGECGVFEGFIPQYQLEAPTGGYALLQSDAVKVSGFTRICHPYRGGQYGWTPEIRQLTAAGWVGVATTSGWEPDEEGQYMTCAEVGPGTYAVFGYWDKPAWWDMWCPPAGYSGESVHVSEVTLWVGGSDPVQGERCGANGTVIFEDGTELDLTFAIYCCNNRVYESDIPWY